MGGAQRARGERARGRENGGRCARSQRDLKRGQKGQGGLKGARNLVRVRAPATHSARLDALSRRCLLFVPGAPGARDHSEGGVRVDSTMGAVLLKLRFALLTFALLCFALLRFAPLRFASLFFASHHSASLRFAPLPFPPLCSATLRFAPLRPAHPSLARRGFKSRTQRRSAQVM